MGAALQQLRIEQQELADQARYEASCARSPTREAYRDKVEQYRAQQRRAGFIIGREEAYHLLLGRDTEARAARVRPGQQRAAAARVAGQRTQPTGARSNMAARGRRPQPGSEEADLAAIRDADARGIKIW
jgi:nucleoid-associated protein YgaU